MRHLGPHVAAPLDKRGRWSYQDIRKKVRFPDGHVDHPHDPEHPHQMNANSSLVTIIGGSGFVGTQLVQRMAAKGYRIRVGVRRPDLAGHLLPLGSVGQILPVQVNVRDFDSVARAVTGAEIVINLAGIWHERAKQTFDAVHDLGAANVARAAAEAGVKKLVHMSGLGADENSSSRDLAARARGDGKVHDAFPGAVILRPATAFGDDDRFFNLFGTWARLFPLLPVIGAEARQQPVFVGDVAQAVLAAVAGKAKAGKIYELGGPDVETMRQIMERTLRESHRSCLLVNAPAGLVRLKAMFFQILPNPWISVDQVTRWNLDNVVSQEAVNARLTIEALGITPHSMDAILPTYMWRFRRHGQFERAEA